MTTDKTKEYIDLPLSLLPLEIQDAHADAEAASGRVQNMIEKLIRTNGDVTDAQEVTVYRNKWGAEYSVRLTPRKAARRVFQART